MTFTNLLQKIPTMVTVRQHALHGNYMNSSELSDTLHTRMYQLEWFDINKFQCFEQNIHCRSHDHKNTKKKPNATIQSKVHDHTKYWEDNNLYNYNHYVLNFVVYYESESLSSLTQCSQRGVVTDSEL